MKLAYAASRFIQMVANGISKFGFWIAVSVLGVSLVHSQISTSVRTLVITGRHEYAKVFEVNGRAYVAVEDLAHITHGSLSFEPERILLTLPEGTQNSTVMHGFSREFLRAAIEQMSDIREWRIAIDDSIRNNSPISEPWITELQRRAQKNLALVGAAKSTDDDQKCYPLIAAEYANMQKLSDRFLSMRRQLTYIDPRSLENDPLDRQILACAHVLSTMAADNQFRDDGQCTEAR